jgi:hypothetical protein
VFENIFRIHEYYLTAIVLFIIYEDWIVVPLV